MAQRHPDSLPAPPAAAVPWTYPLSADSTAGEALAAYLAAQAGEFLRALGLREEDEAVAVRLLRGSSRRISAALQTYEPLVEAAWAQRLRTELGWFNATLSREQRCATHLARLRAALIRLASREGDGAAPGSSGVPGSLGNGPGTGGTGTGGTGTGGTAVGAARAGALLERQLTLARTRAHSTTLQAFGSSRFHAIADSVTLLASEPPLTEGAATVQAPAWQVLTPLAEGAHRRLAEAVEALPLPTAAHPYNGYSLRAALVALPADADDTQDAPWHRARGLIRLSRYALEVLQPPGTGADPSPGSLPVGSVDSTRLHGAAHALDRHREAAAAATAAAAAARTPRITPATAYALGVLHADQRSEVEAARYAFSRLWQGLLPVPAPAP